MNEIDKVYDTIRLLLASDITAYQIEKGTGLSRSKIGRLKNGENSIDNLSLSSAKLLYEYAKDHLNE
ncbi:hypothetical protein KJC18_12460 [Mammaliicoccus sciuri]|uniref:hypothetical protein n=1 Tax=Mammaliicoccus sciuri TaxID=1296 RepID=UPI0009C27C28|nr:hypothetical protein [Mammaliicoccus sciuri]ARB40955.1 hypothetical protein B5728_10010 [Mammaliicoccus sciuri]MCE4981496.1 hypothetical protein [Mammaliicoccus sciuri]MCE5086400.1 hypothetical protein [Mammaliicoccus sciuri]MCE5095937.1 hypothetical protein [Mammaliicoccus sciuri]MCJ0912914.1 hypothetical protein [Mammaliicoccus sciuri]